LALPAQASPEKMILSELVGEGASAALEVGQATLKYCGGKQTETNLHLTKGGNYTDSDMQVKFYGNTIGEFRPNSVPSNHKL